MIKRLLASMREVERLTELNARLTSEIVKKLDEANRS